jgi:hypothetical protein
MRRVCQLDALSDAVQPWAGLSNGHPAVLVYEWYQVAQSPVLLAR